MNVSVIYPFDSIPFIVQPIEITHHLDSFSGSFLVISLVQVYFTPYNTVEVWNMEDFSNLPRRWYTAENAPFHQRLPIAKNTIPVSNINTQMPVAWYDTSRIWENDNPNDFREVYIPGLAYSVLMNPIPEDSIEYYHAFGDGVDSAYTTGSLGERGCWGKWFSGTVSGKIEASVTNDIDQDQTIPLAGIKIRLKENDFYGWEEFGSTYTNEDGEFTISYNECQLMEYDTLGNVLWSKEYFCPNILQSTYHILSTSGGYFLGGACGWGWYYKGTGVDYHEPSDSFMDNFLMKVTESGDSVWTRIFRKQDGYFDNNHEWASQDIMEDMVCTADGGIAATGWFDPFASVYTQYAWVLKTDSNGCGKPGTPYGLWREELPYNADSSVVHLTWQDDDTTNIWHHVQGSKDGAWYFWELTPRMLTTNEFFDTVPKYHNYCYRIFGLDTTWARTCESAEICITTGIDEYAPESGLLALYPNPASNIINCVLPENGKYELFVYDISGNLVCHPTTAPVVSLSGVEDLTTLISATCIEIKQLPSGIYFIEARGERVLRGKFVKE